ncbi:hypothetical protein DPMN_072292 [Dreissena polymorpha]|uniref:Uncharacterized protein n=1 Tax=Dreissena polymorpha TaxID=45954 RepID=A0A9D3Z894_DREPO|nr:hypothetical protein DPMN_072292 [Dreissena polymorpha]
MSLKCHKFQAAWSQQTIYMGPIWVPCGHLYGPHVGCQHGTQMGSATGLHMGPIWAAPFKYMGQPRWDPYGARLHYPSGSHVGSPHGAHIGAHMGPI